MATSMFAGDSRETSGRTMAEMNITPLVDVMLVLLIIFMVAAPMATRSLDLRLPQQPNTEQLTRPHLKLRVAGDGQFVLDGTVLGEKGLAAALNDAARVSPAAIVDVTVSDNADYQAFTTALAITRRSGLNNIALQR